MDYGPNPHGGSSIDGPKHSSVDAIVPTHIVAAVWSLKEVGHQLPLWVAFLGSPKAQHPSPS